MLGGKARAGPWALSVTVMPQLLGLTLTVSFLSPPVSISLLVSLLFLSSLAVSTSCLLALLRPQHPGGSEAMCPWYVSDRAPLPPGSCYPSSCFCFIYSLSTTSCPSLLLWDSQPLNPASRLSQYL